MNLRTFNGQGLNKTDKNHYLSSKNVLVIFFPDC